jgi:predicted RNA binding protein YcfA (HicA-like mRNA interferase family)
MPSVDKIIKKAKQGGTNISYKEIIKVLEYMGYKHSRTKGDHFQYTKKYRDVFTVVGDNPAKKYQIEELLVRLKEEGII